MNKPLPGKSSGRLQLILVILVFAGPLLAAAWLYFGNTEWKPQGMTNHGAILEPIINLTETLPESEIAEIGASHWLLLYLQQGPCDARCRDALFRMRQSRLMLGNEMTRVRRVFLHGDSRPDTVFLEEQHDGLITSNEKGLARLLESKRPVQLAPGGLYLVDPLGNLVMYFSPDTSPRDMVDDLKHLLELSRIG